MNFINDYPISKIGGDKAGGINLFKKKDVISLEEAKTKATDFINKNLVNEGNEVTIKDVVKENSLYKLTVVMKNNQEVTSYISEDGKTFYPQSINISEVEAQAKQTADQTKTNDAAA